MNHHSSSNLRKFLVVLDICILVLSSAISLFIRFSSLSYANNILDLVFSTSFLILCFSAIISLYLSGSYSFHYFKFKSKEILQLIIAVGITWLVLSSLIVIFRLPVTGLLGRGSIFINLSIFLSLSLLSRYILFKLLQNKTNNLKHLVLIENEYLDSFLKDQKNLNRGEQYVYCVTNSNLQNASQFFPFNEWKDLCVKQKWASLIVGLNDENLNKITKDLMQIRLQGLYVLSLSDYYEYTWNMLPVYQLKASWFTFSHGFDLLHNPIGLRIKRFFDILGALLLMIIGSPIMLMAYLAIRIDSKGPGLYSQMRSGKDGSVFKIYKFRSMRTDAESAGAQWAQKNDSRITRIGKFIRKTRIDELPQLWNVLKGDMSFIGPRPERPEFDEQLAKQIPHYELRNLLKPGLSGWAQVCYPYGASVEDSLKKLQYDLYYIKNYSLALDLSIVFRTIRVVLGFKGQ